ESWLTSEKTDLCNFDGFPSINLIRPTDEHIEFKERASTANSGAPAGGYPYAEVGQQAQVRETTFFQACKRKEEQQSHPEQQPAPKKPRLVFTDLQRRTLQAIFKETKRPSKEMQVTIARQLGLEPSTVGNFFMNARRRSMDKWKDDNELTGGSPVHKMCGLSPGATVVHMANPMGQMTQQSTMMPSHCLDDHDL
ncbi:unnamed protein product, partial [Meganyctiphanes norvegica]